MSHANTVLTKVRSDRWQTLDDICGQCGANVPRDTVSYMLRQMERGGLVETKLATVTDKRGRVKSYKRNGKKFRSKQLPIDGVGA